MSAFIRDKFHTSIAQTLYSSIVSGRENYYHYLGKVLTTNIDSLPPDLIGSYQEELDIRNQMIFAKKITPSEVALGVTRYDWTSGTVYDQYDSNVSMVGKKYYVLTSAFNVYLCVSNNYGATSTVSPTDTSNSISTTADGYRWKFLYNIPSHLQKRFLTSGVMPIFRSLTNAFYDNGNIRNVEIVNGGAGYVSDAPTSEVITVVQTPTVPIPSPSGSGAVLYPIINSSGSVVDVYIKSGGTGYDQTTTTLTMSSVSPRTGFYSGSSAVLKPVVVSGAIVKVYIADPGLNYTPSIASSVTITDPNTAASGAIIRPFISDGQVVDAVIERQGANYTSPSLTVVPGSGTPTKTASLRVNLNTGEYRSTQSTVEQTAVSGSIDNISITNAGSGYSVAPTLTITGDGTGAIATCSISGGNVVSVTILNRGSGYTYASIAVSAGNATFSPIISPIGGHGFDAPKQLKADLLILTSTVSNETINGIKFDNDYRDYGILANPKQYSNGLYYTSPTGSTCFSVTTSGSLVGFTKGGTAFAQSTKEFEIVFIEESTKTLILRPKKYNDIISNGDTINSGVNTFIVSGVTYPDINRISGDLLYSNNQMSIDYSDVQSVTIKTIIKL